MAESSADEESQREYLDVEVEKIGRLLRSAGDVIAEHIGHDRFDDVRRLVGVYCNIGNEDKPNWIYSIDRLAKVGRERKESTDAA